jgi:NADPH-dependent 7-cyano-7-deazaguanine reductase QueF
VAAVAPRSISVIGKFWIRGGISTTVTVTHTKA